MLFLALLLRLHKNESPYTPYFRSGFIISAVALLLNLSFCPSLLKYQSSTVAAFYITEQDINELKTRDIRFDILQTFDGFNITMLNLKFLNKKTRKEELKKTYLIQLL